MSLCDELAAAVGDMSESEVQELRWRTSAWLSTHTTQWRGRGDKNDRVGEISILGALTGVLRESRPHLTAEFVERMVDWSQGRVEHLNKEQQEIMLAKVRRTMEVRGRIPGAVAGYGSGGAGPIRYIDGVWDLATWATILSNNDGGKELPWNLRELAARNFNAAHGKRRVAGTDYAPGSDASGGCPVCIGDALFRGMVDNRPGTAVLQCSIWGVLHYHILGLGDPTVVMSL